MQTLSSRQLLDPSATPWRALTLLALAVLTAHALLLGQGTAWLGTATTPATPAPAKPVVMVTRQLAAPKPTAATAAPLGLSQPLKIPVFKPKQPLAGVLKPSSAIVSDEFVSTAIVDVSVAPGLDIGLPTATSQTLAAPATAAPSALAPPAVSAQPVTVPASVVLRYDMRGNAKGLTYHANAELAWRNLGSSYDARLTVSALFLGSRSMQSQGDLSAVGLAPVRFSDKTRSEVAAHFEPDKGLITFSANTPSAPWRAGAQDRISVFFQVGGLLAANPAGFPAGTVLAMYTAGPRAADTWAFEVQAEEVLSLPYGHINTVKLMRLPQREYDQTVELWLAPALNYLPVRNKITQSSGDFIDQQLSELVRP